MPGLGFAARDGTTSRYCPALAENLTAAVQLELPTKNHSRPADCAAPAELDSATMGPSLKPAAVAMLWALARALLRTAAGSQDCDASAYGELCRPATLNDRLDAPLASFDCSAVSVAIVLWRLGRGTT